MNASPMIREVDKIVANLLIAEGAVCIPSRIVAMSFCEPRS